MSWRGSLCSIINLKGRETGRERSKGIGGWGEGRREQSITQWFTPQKPAAASLVEVEASSQELSPNRHMDAETQVGITFYQSAYFQEAAIANRVRT